MKTPARTVAAQAGSGRDDEEEEEDGTDAAGAAQRRSVDLADLYRDRAKEGKKGGSEKDFSPVFVLFLDAVWQMWQQRPAAFEFNEALLLFLADCYYDARFGTFLYSTQKQRVEHSATTRTVSVWTHVLSRPHDFSNPLYEPATAGAAAESSASAQMLCPAVSFATLRLWPAFFLRHSPAPLAADLPAFYAK